jgi:hypothetical protein
MKSGYVIAQYKTATNYFTTTSSYDRPRWIPITEASVYQTAEIAQQAISKLWKNGAYSAKLLSITEVMNSPNSEIPPSIGNSKSANKFSDEQYGDEPTMKSGTLDDIDDMDETNLDDDNIEFSDDLSDDDLSDDNVEFSDDLSDDDLSDDDIEFGNGLSDDDLSDDDIEFGNGLSDDDLSDDESSEENEQSFMSPIERGMMKNNKLPFPTGNGPMKEGMVPNLRNTQGNVPLKKPTTGDGRRGIQGPTKLSDADVRNMRTMYDVQGKSKQTIYKKWNQVEEKTIDKILNYTTRLGASCDIDYKEKPTKKVTENKTIATDLPTTPTIKFKQQVGEPTDVDFTRGIDSMHNPHKTPANIIKTLKDSIKEFQDAADYNNGKDDSQSSMAMTICSALQDILTDLQQDTIEGLRAAQIRITTYMNPITTNFPHLVIDYLYKSGRQPISLKNMFYDTWDMKRKEDQNY